MLPSADSAPLCKPTLCNRCRNLNLTAADFFVNEQEAKETPNPHDVYDPITKDVRTWRDVEEARDCPLCHVIKWAVEDTRASWLSPNGPHSCELQLKRLYGSHSVDRMPKDVRYLEFRKIREHVLVFDVEQQCLVRLPTDGRYLALSYVWGTVQSLRTLKENVQSFMAPNGLLSIMDQLPKVILDAARLTEQLGERYLWVDALCIIQDDTAFQDLLISAMNTIYENAFLTIFAATGADSNAGLPGVRPTQRGRSQLTAEITKGLKLVLPIRYQNIKQSKWATRGWTYQEYFFSKRRLLFVEGQVIYRCSNIRWREDIAQEHLAQGIVHFQVDTAGSRTNWEPPNVRFPNAPRDKWDRHHFNTYVETYLDRNLTFDSDILSAFAGIISGANDRQLPITWGLTEKHISLDILWLPYKWVTRRPGFPSWSWAGWKGPVISYRDYLILDAEIWQQRKSWIDWYIFDKASSMFRLLSTGYAPLQEAEVTQKEESERRWREPMKQNRRGQQGADIPDEEQDSDSSGKLASLLWRLGGNQGMQAPPIRGPPYSLQDSSAINEQTLHFRTLTAHVWISSLKPNREPPRSPIDDQLILPSAPTLHLYAADGTHIGCAWAHTQELFDSISSYDRDVLLKNPLARRQHVEIALLAGPLKGDWRSRVEKATTYQYTQALVSYGLNVASAVSRYEQKMLYEQEICKIYVDMVRERQAAEPDVPGVESRLTVEFCEQLEDRVLLADLGSRFPGHCEETMRPAIDGLTSAGFGMRAKEGQQFIKVMLMGDLTGEGSGGSSGAISERIGMGEIRDDAMGLIQGLAFRDVFLK
ncbi:heterokaryon incompatibility protein-domain-containing protein [Xylaria bambusicola]|uniref:heterokaryon incompatibility protein-domain-containing protein n=1 Tax=Xylaria bambusicola TaxID=326684 RepID=UPI002008A62D|nr:heterokaryon incompatibility protein-domain-containing protein [Xylaria bambusicola]KAI0517907.1 heterokaryon incompatibility protein-domain-containing protein [Xylaria bambusicola]